MVAVLVTGLVSAAGNHIEGIELVTKSPQQGSMIIVKYAGQGDVFFEDKKLNKTADDLLVFGVGRESAPEIFLTIKNKNNQKKFPISIKKRDWKIERVDGLPPSKVTPPQSAEVLARIKQETSLVKKARNSFSDLTYFSQPFILPAVGRISGVYGSQRVLNGEPKNPHYGLDIANKSGTPVVSPADGKVLLIHQDMFYSGGTLIIDHGYGINSSYIHLNSIEVKEGQLVKQGERIATIGATGRATGPHLDWRLNWFQTRLDPQLLIQN